METLELKSLGLQELDSRELIGNNGGFIFMYAAVCTLVYFAAAGAHLAYDALTDYENSH